MVVSIDKSFTNDNTLSNEIARELFTHGYYMIYQDLFDKLKVRLVHKKGFELKIEEDTPEKLYNRLTEALEIPATMVPTTKTSSS